MSPTTAPAKADYSVLPSLSRRFDRVARSMGFEATDRASWQRWRKKLLPRLRQITGYDTMQPAPLRPRITEEKEFPGYVRQRIELQTEPGVVMTLYALVPAGLKGRAPAIMCPHGHASGGKYSPAGRTDLPEIARQVEVFNYDYGVQFCKLGFVAFCPDARGFGERQEASVKREADAATEGKGDILRQSCQYLNQMGYPLGQTVTGMWAFDLHRLVDYIETRKDCDASRIGCAGLSGGGLQTLWATALDDRDRIKAAVVSGYFYGYRQSLLVLHQNCSCNYVPHLYETVDMGDLGALIAPRPLLIETGTKDPLNGAAGVKNVTSQVRITRRAYKLLGAEDRLVHDVFEGEHLWHGVEALPFMQRWLGQPTTK